MLTVIMGGVDQSGIVFQKGLFGGYPSPGLRYFYVKDTNLEEVVDTGRDLPRSIVECERWLRDGRCRAEKFEFSTGPRSPPLKEGDLCGLYYTGGAGCGDPLERESSRVLGDVEMGIVSPDFARKAYGALGAAMARGRPLTPRRPRTCATSVAAIGSRHRCRSRVVARGAEGRAAGRGRRRDRRHVPKVR